MDVDGASNEISLGFQTKIAIQTVDDSSDLSSLRRLTTHLQCEALSLNTITLLPSVQSIIAPTTGILSVTSRVNSTGFSVGSLESIILRHGDWRNAPPS